MGQFEDKPPYRWRTVRIFISSTFRDFHAERDYLVKYVFPDLRQWCEKWKLHLVDIDLRWGVTQQEAESGKVIDICLEQVDGARPFFICMLGNRYGWVPEKDEVPAETHKHYDKLTDKEGYSVTHLEIHHAVLEPLSSLDEVERVPHAFFYFRDPGCLPAPETLQTLSDEERDEYQKAFFESDTERKNKLKALKEEIQNHYEELGKKNDNPNEVSERIFNYSPLFDDKVLNPEDDKLKGRLTRESLKELGERVMSDLQKVIGRQFQERISELSEKREEDKLETERDYQEAFIENRTILFIGRTELLNRLHGYVNSNSRKILAFYGESGSGKSALLAQFYKQLTESNSSGLELIIPHFIGASPASTSLPTTLTRFLEELKKKFNIEDEIPVEVNKMEIVFEEFMKKCTGKVLIIIDGLNQLDEMNYAHELTWLPTELPENVKIIASTLVGDTKEALSKKTDESLTITPLSDEERREIVRLIPSVFCRTLDEHLIDLLLTKEETRNPLYLKVSLDELRVFGSFEKLGEMIKTLPDNVIDLFVHLLNRLEKENSTEITERLFCLLECSRFGLTIQELKDLMAEVDEDNIYIAILRQIRNYLHNRGELIDFFHRGLSKAIRKKFFDETGEDAQKEPELVETT